MNDRLTEGFVAGILAGFPALAWALLSRYILHLATMFYSDFAIILTLGQKAKSLPEKAFGHFVVFIFFGFLGVAFVYLVRSFGRKNIALKGALWGGFIWLLSHVTTVLFKVPGLLRIPLKTAVSQFISGVIWGISLAIVFAYLERRIGNPASEGESRCP